MAVLAYIQNQLAVSVDWLIENNVMTASNARQLAARLDVQKLQRGCNGRHAMIAYDSMPDRFKEKIMSLIPNPHDVARTNLLQRYMKHDAIASAYYDLYETQDGRHLPADVRRTYYANACVMRAIDSLLTIRTARLRTRCGRAVKSWSGISEQVMQLDQREWPAKLPSNDRSLQRLYLRWKAEGDAVLIHRNYTKETSNSAKVNDEMKESILLRLISDPRNFDDQRVAAEYNKIAASLQWEPIARSTVANWRQRNDIYVTARRHGGNYYNNTKTMQVKRSKPTAAMLMWCADGWDAELLYQKHEGGRTTFGNRLTMVVILDTYCNYPIGYAIGDHETPELIAEALRNAIRHTEELFGQKMQAVQFQCDNYAIKKMKPLYQQVAKYVTPARVGNAKSKVIEPWFRYFNDKYCHGEVNWSGYGVTASKMLQPNADYLNKNKQNFPELAECVAQLASKIEAERAELRAQYVAGYTADTAKNIAMSEAAYLQYFGKATARTVLLQGTGITVTIDGQKHQYECFDTAMRRNNATRWTVLYDPADTSKALATDESGALQFMMEEKYVQPMALADRKEGDAAELQRVRDFNKKLREEVSDKICEVDANVEELIGRNRELLTYSKLLLTDSEGQHKDRRNAARTGGKKPDDGMFDERSIYDEY